LRDGWRANSAGRRSLRFRHGEEEQVVEVAYRPGGYGLTVAGQETAVSGQLQADDQLRLDLGGRRLTATVVVAQERRHVFLDGRAYPLAAVDPLHHAGDGGGAEGGLAAPMPGKVIALLAEVGSTVEKGTPLLILEAMKMEHTIAAPAAGVVKAYNFSVGEQVSDGAELVEFEVSK
jgi:3-methylcrotonyl-CoA carboxylase alpha subunit